MITILFVAANFDLSRSCHVQDYEPIQTPPSPVPCLPQDEESEEDSIRPPEEGYHDASNDLDPDEDQERILSGTLSESSGNAGSYLYDYKV